MNSRNHENIKHGISSGAWIPKSLGKKPPHVNAELPKAIYLIKPTPLRRAFSNADDAFRGKKRQCSLTTSVLALFLFVVFSVVVLTFAIRGEGVESSSTFPEPSPPMPDTTMLKSTSQPKAPSLPLNTEFFMLSQTTCRRILGNQIIILTNNDRCEDGGDGSVAALCELGTDYPDCPQRAVRP